ncbi:hypothetical protein [Pareuzebyella sediminis]|uniref:hypothetical protein n=1 Tax=Pareuzebyella sediminis TaxID=2607998 RepID=UPI0011EC0248|nr:hypothetical protein [Pareuzebyella sediminis]
MSTSKKILKAPFRISIAMVLFGMLSSILQWSYSEEILLLAFSSTAIIYTVRFWKKTSKTFLDYNKLILILSWALNGIFQVSDLPHAFLLQVITAITFIIWFVMEGTAYFLDENRKRKNNFARVVWNSIMVIGTLAIIAGSILNILDWQFSIPLLCLGIVIVVAYILKDILPVNNSKVEDHNNEEFQL